MCKYTVFLMTYSLLFQHLQYSLFFIPPLSISSDLQLHLNIMIVTHCLALWWCDTIQLCVLTCAFNF